MQPNTQYCQPDLYSNYLHTIKGIKFTRRQVDILACLSTGRNAKTIANFLEIESERTVHAHELTIREKLGCGSRDSIIGFLEKCEEFPALKKYHQILRTHFLFENSAQKIAALIGPAYPKLVIVSKDSKELNTASILKSLEYYLKQIGIKICIQQKVSADPTGTPFIILGEHTPASNDTKKINVDFKTLNSFYINLFELIKKLLPNIDLSKVETEFKQEYTAIHNGEQPVVIHARDSLIITKNLKGTWLLFFKERTNKAIPIVFLCLCVFGAWLLVGKAKPKDNSEDIQSIHSDLIIPTDSALLKRPELLKQIEQKLNQRKGIQTVALVGIVGMGGVGKTTIARHFGRLQTANLVWELNAESKESLINSFKDLAYALAKTKEEKEELEFIKAIQIPEEKEKQLLIFVKHHLKSNSNWLLIYDNVDTFQEIKNYLPQDVNAWGNGKIIITTRDKNIQNTSYVSPSNVIELGELSYNEALTLFTKILYNCTSEQLTLEQKDRALEFLKQIPSFPLDVSIAAYYIKDTHITYEQYLERIHQYGKNFEALQTSFLKEGTNYEKTRYGIISLSFKKLIEINPEFRDLLFFICLLDSQNIPISLLEAYKDPKILNSFMHALRKYSLITSEALQEDKNTIHTFNLHRSTQCLGKEFLLTTLKENVLKSLLEQITNATKNFYEKYNGKNYKQILAIIPHLEALVKNLEKLNIPKILMEEYKIKLLFILGYSHYNHSQNLILIKECFNQIKELNLKHKKLSNTELAYMLRDLGGTCADIGLFDESMTHCQESIKRSEKIPNSELIIAENLMNLGSIYTSKNDFEKGKYYYEAALNKISKIDDIKTKELASQIYNRLGWHYISTFINRQRGFEAKKYTLKALEILEGSKIFYNTKINSKLSCLIAKYKITLGRICCGLGQYKEAMDTGFKEAQYIIDNSLDNCSYNLFKISLETGIGEVLLREGNLAEAKNKLSKGIEDALQFVGEYWTFFPKILRAEANIRSGNLKEAYKDCNEVLNNERNFRQNYWNLMYLTCFYHAAFIKYKQKDQKKSTEHFTDFFKGMQEFCAGFLDEKEYKTLETKGAFTAALSSSNNAKENITKYLKNSVEIFTAIYGKDHPFVKDYIVPNYEDAIKPWWKFW